MADVPAAVAELAPNGRAALAYAAEFGWAVMPLHTPTVEGCSCRQASCESVGKHPRTMNGLKGATTDAEQIRAWWRIWPDANVGIATGATSGLVVVDVDGPEGEAALDALGGVPLTPTVLTGKGRHLYFLHPGGEVRNSAGRLGAKVDTRGDGGYVVAPPSVHASGARYTWDRARELSPRDCALAPLPAAILAALERPRAAPGGASGVSGGGTAALIPLMGAVPNGQRNQTLTEYAGRLLAKGHGELETYELVAALNVTKCAPPLDDDEVRALVASIGAAERRKPARALPAFAAPGESAPPPESPRVPLIRAVTREKLDALARLNAAPIDATPTMLPAWNDASRGFGGGEGLARGWHITIGGASGTGKSLIALNLCAAALHAGRKVAYVSLEMSTDQLLARMLAIATGCPVRALEPGRLYEPETYRDAADAFELLCDEKGGEFAIAERPPSDISGIAHAMRAAVDTGSTLLVVDYMQLAQAVGAEGIFENTRRVSSAIQRVAFDCNVTTVGLSQFNRSMSFNKDAPPTIYGLTGGSSLENDSDQVILLDHTANKRTGQRMDGRVLLAKNRHGPSVDVDVVWDFTTLRVRERASSGINTEERHGLR